MRIFNNQIFILFNRFLAACACVILTQLILQPFRYFLDIQTVALLYLLPVMVSTALWGLMPGILAALIAFFVFNYYYIEPFHTLQVHKTQDIITLIIFLIVAVVISQLIGRAREGLQLAQKGEWEATRMYELLAALAGLQDDRTIAEELVEHTLSTFQLEYVEITIFARLREEYLTVTAGNELPTAPPGMTRSLKTARSQEGEIRIWSNCSRFSTQEMRLLEAYINQGALMLERVRLTQTENKARVLEESNQLKTSLLNSVSHELRTPLAVIKASVSSIRSDTGFISENARQDLLATIEEETDHLNLLVGNLLDMSRIESGALTPQRKWNSIEEIAIGVMSKMSKQLKSHQIICNFPDDLPLIPTDYVLIEQVFMNLISNSIKYAPPGTVISVTASLEQEFMHVTVANQGPLVPEQHLERIFDKFYRLTETEKVTGTGLGLSICKGIIDAHGGKIWAENQLGHFEFHFTIPSTIDGILPDIPKEESLG